MALAIKATTNIITGFYSVSTNSIINNKFYQYLKTHQNQCELANNIMLLSTIPYSLKSIVATAMFAFGLKHKAW